MKYLIIVLSLIYLISCEKISKYDYDRLYSLVRSEKMILEFGNFILVQRSESDSYLYSNVDYNVDYWFVINSDTLNPFTYYEEGENNSDNYLMKNYQDDFKRIKSLITKTIKFNSLLIRRFNLDAINGKMNNKGNVELIFSSKEDIDL
ncbi:MAG: hypothetical protein Q8M94_12695, partial [Ignavibacteria bacterium]|nr:hypothetical protein [Ignavibacteria bacterium]